jgi:hypothetical protein
VNGGFLTHARSAALLGAGGALGGLAVLQTITHGWWGLALLAMASGTGIGLVMRMPVPFGGSVPIAYALTIALADLLDPRDYAVTAVMGLAIGITLRGAHDGTGPAVALATRSALPLAVAALIAATPGTAGLGPVADVVILGACVLAVDLLVCRIVETQMAPRAAAGVYLTLLCGGALIAITHREIGPWMAGLALFPLLVTRFSFERRSSAHETLRQTIQALGIVPELAGLSPLGHSERTACYASAIARGLGLDPHHREVVETAARLHRLGILSLDPTDPNEQMVENPDPAEVAALSAAVLREAGLADEVATLIESARAGTFEDHAGSLDAAVVRVASAFDELVGEQESLADQALSIVAAHARDPHTRRAVAALMALVAAEPHSIHDAIAAGARFTAGAADLDVDALVAASSGGQLLHFGRRRA